MKFLVIDDEPQIGLTLQELFPHDQVQSALDGLLGLELVRELGSAFDLVILDIKMPYNGINVALQLRHEFPRLRILPYSFADDNATTLTRLGISAPLLSKPARSETLRQRVLEALALPPPEPLPDQDWIKLLLKQAKLEESERNPPAAVGVLASAPLLGMLFQSALRAANQSCYILSHPQHVSALIGRFETRLLLADAGQLSQARQLAQRHQLPLLAVSLTIAEGFRLLDSCQHVLVSLDDLPKLSQALAHIDAGRPYVDPLISERLNRSGLTRRVQEVIPLLLQGYSGKIIAQRMGISIGTAHDYTSEVFTTLNCQTLGHLIEYLNDTSATIASPAS